jgi:Tfp pilus assembly ATPase PilU
MIGLDQYLGDLVAADFVTPEEALEKALDKENFKTVVEKRRAVKASPPTAGSAS